MRRRYQNGLPGGPVRAALALLACAALLLMLSASCSLSSPRSLELVIYDSRAAAVLARVPVQPEEVFTLSYRHSVSNSPVEGTFACTAEGLIRPLTTTFLSFGPGLPLTEGEVECTLEDGRIVVRHPPELRESIRLWASALTEERLAAGGRVFDLYNSEVEPRLVVIFLARRGEEALPSS